MPTFRSKYVNNRTNNNFPNKNYKTSQSVKTKHKNIPTSSQTSTEGNIFISGSLNKGPKGRYNKGFINKIDMIDVSLSICINPGEFKIKKTYVRFKGNNFQTDWKSVGNSKNINKVFDFQYSSYIEAEIKTIISIGLLKTKTKTITIAKQLF